MLANAREARAQVPVVVRTQDDLYLDKLQAAGATEVVPEAIEGSLMLAGHLLALVGVPMRRVIRTLQDQREARYGLLRGYFHGADDDASTGVTRRALTSLTLPPGAQSLGQPLAQLTLHAIGVRVVSVRHGGGRRGCRRTSTRPGRRRYAGALGHPTALALAEDKPVARWLAFCRTFFMKMASSAYQKAQAAIKKENR